MELLQAYGLPTRLGGYRPRFNITPSEIQWTILRAAGNLEARGLRWGLVPSWSSDPSIGSRMINARADSVAEKPSFRDALRNGRCLVITDGYYEWAKTGAGKTPYRFCMTNRKPFVFAGLWDRWLSGDSIIESCTIITTEASAATAHLHHRMPVILDFDESMEWMRPNASPTQLLRLLRPYEKDELEMFEVSRAVNSPKNDTEECIRPVREARS
ncbi:MAG: SOS response-associated peptidase [Gemmatimonadaceae bacterium]|nr:SOS response-associated peptidase [Gemmatimonadaceae bacterium]